MNKKMSSGVYQIRNISNNKVYIGSTSNFYKRWLKHKTELNTKNHHSNYLQNSWTKYGKNMFIFEILEYVDDKRILLEREQVWIDFKHPEYNMGLVAGGFDFQNHPRGKELLEKFKNQLIEYNKSERGRAKGRERCGERNNLWKGGISKFYCMDCKKSISYGCKRCAGCAKKPENNPLLGKKHSEETKLKMRKPRNKISHWAKSVKINNEIFSSISRAAMSMNVSDQTIVNRIRNNCLGYSFN